VSRRIMILPAIPRGPSGKAQGAALRKLVMALLMDREEDGNNEPRTDADDTLTQVLVIAARVFRVPQGSLSTSSTAEDVAGWDSFTHLNLILSVERDFNVQISVRQISTLRDLGDLARAVDIRTCRV
jgi:acyl carrier protein